MSHLLLSIRVLLVTGLVVSLVLQHWPLFVGLSCLGIVVEGLHYLQRRQQHHHDQVSSCQDEEEGSIPPDYNLKKSLKKKQKSKTSKVSKTKLKQTSSKGLDESGSQRTLHRPKYESLATKVGRQMRVRQTNNYPEPVGSREAHTRHRLKFSQVKMPQGHYLRQ